VSLNAGDRDREIVLQTVTLTTDPISGEDVKDWTTIDPETLWAEWLPGNTREAYQAQQRLGAYVDGLFRIAGHDRPAPDTQRIVFDGRTYDIKGVTEIGRGEGWELSVTARGEGS
jgi:SPP1 family predicted phage head-tail adaptor